MCGTVVRTARFAWGVVREGGLWGLVLVLRLLGVCGGVGGGVVGLSNCAGLLFVCSLSFAWVVLFMLPMFQFVACWCLCTDRD